jgi:hypothetical protein
MKFENEVFLTDIVQGIDPLAIGLYHFEPLVIG